MKWSWKYSNENQTLWRNVINAKYEEEDHWTMKEITTPYGASLWRSIRILWKTNIKVKVVNGAKTDFWKDEWHEAGRLENLFPRYSCISLSSTKDYCRILDIPWMEINFRRHLNDWEIQSVADFFNIIEQFNGLEVGQDTLWWKGNKKGQFKVSNAYMWMNQTPQCISNCSWKGIWKNETPHKVACFIWLLLASQGSSSHARQSDEEKDTTLS
ncbi:hypothetical protein MTR67_047909 [Solanum verrucosum]|uniref:Reverse transcriptase zinc-binding domain-containing protein n=1 Tax=Solanum verrucosum TaxID=315347 RepID=A0AAF0UZW1_SOLVR|nr:hypothetical protein MTR67_047909 [Solanum verrucosum]